MTQVGSVVTAVESNVELWYYTSPVNASRNISIPNTGTETIRYVISDYTNATYDASYFGTDSNNTTTASPQTTIASVPDGSVCVSCNGHGEKDAHTAFSPGTHILDDGTAGEYSYDEGSRQTACGYSIQSGTGDETHTWTADGSDDSCIIMGAWEETAASSSSRYDGQRLSCHPEPETGLSLRV